MCRRAAVPRERRGVPRVPERLECVRAVAPLEHEPRLQRQHGDQTAEHAGRVRLRPGRRPARWPPGSRARPRARAGRGAGERGTGDAGALALCVRLGVLLAAAAGGAAARADAVVRRGLRARETVLRATFIRERLGRRVPPAGTFPQALLVLCTVFSCYILLLSTSSTI